MAGVGSRGKTTDGSWRPDTPFSTNDGLKVTMRRAANLTPAGILKVPFRFQTPPLGDLARDHRFSWSTFDTVSGGQRARPMGAQLLEQPIDVMLMDRLAAEATSGVVVWDDAPHPQRILNELRFIAGVDQPRKGKAAPFRLTISQPAIWGAPIINTVAVLTRVAPTQRAGHLATEFLSLTFLEYPELSAGRQRRQDRPSRRHKLRSTDSLHELAKRYLHRASAWKQIAKANGIRGVDPGSEDQLWKWAKRNHKTHLVIPRSEAHGRDDDVRFSGAVEDAARRGEPT